MANNVIYTLSKKFALRIIRLYLFLRDERNEYVMSKQIYRCGTSIGANIAESRFGQSDADHISKLSIALKEASETLYWLELLYEAEYVTTKQFDSLYNDAKIIVGTLVNIINKLKSRTKIKTTKEIYK